MEKNFNLKVSVKINEKCLNVIDQVSFNHLILCGKQQRQHKKYQVDKIYSTNDNNQKLFENILRVPSNLMLQGFSSVVFCLGSPNSGKTYSLAGKTNHLCQSEGEPGIIIYMMRRLFSKFKHEVSLYSTYSFWCKFLSIERGRVRNLNGQISQQELKNDQNSKILIKNYSHFQQLIQMVYNTNNNKCHIIIQLILQKDTPNQQPTTSSVTFVQFGSFFYNCPYREAEQLSIQNDIEATLITIKNLRKAKENGTNIFDSSLLTKILKVNFLKSCSFEFLGMLDDSYQNNLKTLSFLQIIMHKKQSYGYTKNVKQEIKRQQVFLKGLYQKHRKVLNLLSRCIGMELGYLDKKKKKNFDGPILSTFYKTCEKIKYANQKKLQNEKLLEEIKKSFDFQKDELSQINREYEQKFNNLQDQKVGLVSAKEDLLFSYETIISPNIKFSNIDNCLYYKIEELDQKELKKNVGEQQQQAFVGNDSDRQSKNQAKSFRMLTSTPQITTRKNINPIYQQVMIKDKQHQKYERSNQQQIKVLSNRRINQIKSQIGKLFNVIISQQQQIIQQSIKIPMHFNTLQNKIKNRHKNLDFNPNEAKSFLVHNNLSQNLYEYEGMIENLKIHKRIQKDLINNPNSLCAISMKSLKSDKQFRIL